MDINTREDLARILVERTLYTKPTVQRFLDALSALGLAIVPKEANDRLLRSDKYIGTVGTVYRDMIRAENILERPR
jgi:hypothetical protein